MSDKKKQFIHPEDDPNQGNEPVVATPPAPVTDPEAEAKARAKEYADRFMSANIPQAKLDQDKLDRIKRMGRINQIGKGINVLGDIFSTAIGGNVNKPKPDTVTPELVRQREMVLDQYKHDKDIYDVRNFEKARQDAQFGLGRTDKETAEARHDKDLAARDKISQRTAETADKKWALEHGYKTGMLKQRQDDLEYKRKNGGNKGADKEKAKYTVSTQKQKYPLAQEEFEYYKGAALQNTTLLKKKYPDWFVQVPERDEFGDAVPGKYTLKLDSRINDKDLVRAMMELHEESNAKPKSSTRPFDPTAPTSWNLGSGSQPPPPVPGKVTGPSQEEMKKNAEAQKKNPFDF